MRKAAVIEPGGRPNLAEVGQSPLEQTPRSARARALSLAAEDRTNLQISAEVGLHYNAIGKTRARFVEKRLGGGRKVRPHQTHWPPEVRDNGQAYFFALMTADKCRYVTVFLPSPYRRPMGKK
jgi:hypothetical protein